MNQQQPGPDDIAQMKALIDRMRYKEALSILVNREQQEKATAEMYGLGFLAYRLLQDKETIQELIKQGKNDINDHQQVLFFSI